MAIIETITSASQFSDRFSDMGRGDQFSYEARKALFEYYDEMDEPVELDVIAICCDWNELDLETINQDYSKEFETLDEAFEWLNEQSYAIKLTDTVLFQVF